VKETSLHEGKRLVKETLGLVATRDTLGSRYWREMRSQLRGWEIQVWVGLKDYLVPF